jgi:hypothetical protein
MSFRGVLGQDTHISEYQVQQTPSGARGAGHRAWFVFTGPSREGTC